MWAQYDTLDSPNGRFLVQETFPKTLPRFVINIDISPEMAAQSPQRNQAFCVTASDWSPITSA